MSKRATFAERLFLISGVYGLLVLVPQYFLLDRIGRDTPPAVTHVEYFYGFVGVAIAFQFVFLIISSNPPRYKPFMLAGVLEKLLFGLPVVILYFQDRVAAGILMFGLLDLFLALLFAAAWASTRR